MGNLKLDLSYAIQAFRKSPGFTAVSVLTLALGIGATTAIFSVMNAAMFRALPFPDPENVVLVTEVHQQEGFQRSPNGGIRDLWNEESDTIERVGTFGPITEFALSGERAYFNRVDVDAFRVLGVQPVLGRWYESDEVMIGGTAQTIVISYDLWQRRFDGDPDVIGKPLPDWNAGWGETIIGVMPEGFRVAPWLDGADAWHAMDSTPSTVARLNRGVSLDQARDELDAMALAYRRETGDPEPELWRLELEPLGDLFSEQYAGTLYLLLGAVGLVLLIACANVANLQLSRAAARRSEMATRAALGASRGRLVRQLLSENLLLALIGGVLSLAVALVGIRVFVTLAPDFYPPTDEIRLDLPVLFFTLGVSISVGILFGLIPAFSGSRTNLHGLMRQARRGRAGGQRQWVRRMLVVVEVAMALVLLVGAGLMINSYARVVSVDPGFDADRAMTMELNLRGLDGYRIVHNAFSDYEVLPEADSLFTRILDGLGRIPGVESVGMTSVLPPSGGFGFGVSIPTHPEIENAGAQYQEVNGDFFRALGVRLLDGRTFTELDAGDAPAVIVLNEAAAAAFFPGENAIGRQLQIQMGNDRMREVVGVVGDTRTRLQNDPQPTMYVPYTQHVAHYPNATVALVAIEKDFVLRTTDGSPPVGLGTSMREAVRAADPAVAVDGIVSMQTRLTQTASSESFLMRLLGAFAGLGIFLAAIGIYGVVSYSVVQRTEEFGIRAALGAPKGNVIALVLREGLGMTGIGLIIGVGAAFGLTRLIESQLFGITPMDPLTIVTVALILVATAAAACYFPARRAANQDPMTALRVE